jgi:hypothetical protein
MDRLRLLVAFAIAFLATPAFAQAPRDLAGSWTLVSSTIQQGGNTIQPFGTEPKGALILEANGRYIAMIARAGLPKFAGDNRLAGTPDEYKAIVNGTIAHFGSYTVAGSVITFRIETSTYPNWDGTEQKRSYSLSGDTLTYTVGEASVGGGSATLVWKRAK